MNDFFKIFTILCLVIGAFLFGRNYGEESFRQSIEFQSLLKKQTASDFTNNDLENVRAKLQNIINVAENKKIHDVLSQFYQVFKEDLNLKIPEIITKTELLPAAAPAAKVIISAVDKEAEKEKSRVAKIKKMSSYEWMLTNAQSGSEVKDVLKHVEIKNMDSFLKNSKPVDVKKISQIFGSYRGRLFSVDGNAYSTLIFNVQSSGEVVNLKVETIQNGRSSLRTAETNQPGFMVEGSPGLILNFGTTNAYYQLYKNNDTNQLAGYFYERLVNGTTKTIGSFVLNRVDQF
ncbi:MAG: hypothetical protein H7328_10300 [Bdellovibrio sp.]|nr:hypothetical protein [Bdellovibrio sp.]